MTAYMIIAPAWPEADRKWIELGDSFRIWFLARRTGSWSLDDIDCPIDPKYRTATLRTVIAPGWRIPLQFWIDDGLNDQYGRAIIPQGYVLPGGLQGHLKPSIPVCRQCYCRSDYGLCPRDDR